LTLEIVGAFDRYQVVRRIGAGGMGVVYEVEDPDRSQKVALKTISNPDVEKVYRLKREFRALADLSHPNLVALYDLVVADQSCFFTMELLDGVDFITYVSAHERKTSDAFAMASTIHTPMHPMPTGEVLARGSGELPTERLPSPCNFDRLRMVLPQLAQGLSALHAAGKIHRDVKPSNIQVTSDGRVVLLDFGLVSELDHRHGVDEIVGTVPYMAPEQCAGDVALTAAADWYAMGVVLFEAMTGKLPFDGAPMRVLITKQTEQAPRASTYATNIPPDLDELCARLLERDPTERPTGQALLRQLGVTDSQRISQPAVSISRDTSFVGREQELAAFEHALAPVTRGVASVVMLRSPSGLGKTALINRFLDRVRATHANSVVLRGRCLEREDVPYKAFDHVVDELSEWWRAKPRDEASEMLPRDACLLPMLFPVLDRVPAIADAPRVRVLADPQARRTQAFAALRETLQRFADRHTVVLVLDDMQWVDRDTTALLADLMRAPDPPSVMLVLATRAEGSAPILEMVQRMAGEHTIIDLAPLPQPAAELIARTHLGEGHDELVAKLVREADGNPLFLVELTRYVQGRELEDIAGKGLDAMLAERIDNLGDAGRLVAELVAVAMEPITRKLLAAVSGIPNAELTRLLSTLRAQRVVRVTGSRAEDTIETHHERIRRVVFERISVDRRMQHHRKLATNLSGIGTAEQLARHWYAAGDVDHAAGHARRAAEEARSRLDFDRSARWYAIALEGTQWSESERRNLRTQLADALADSGRPREATDQFLAAAEGADASTALELRRRASGVLLQSGYFNEGLALTRKVLAGVGLRMAKSPTHALFSMLMRRAWLRIRGLGYKPRSLAEISQAELTRVDVCEGVSFGLSMIDTFRGMDFGTRFLLSALRLGEKWRVWRALALETDFLAAIAEKGRAVKLLQRLADLTEDVEEVAAKPQLLATRGFVEFFVHNRYRNALDFFSDAITTYRTLVGRAGFELDTVTLFRATTLYYCGELAELSRIVPAMAEAAKRSGNRYTAVTLQCAFPIAWLAHAEPDAIEADLDAAIASWTSADNGYQLQHLLALSSRIDLALYRGEPDRVTDRIGPEMKGIRRGLLDRPPLQGMMLHFGLVRHAVARALLAPADSATRRDALADARKHTRALRSKLPLVRCSRTICEAMVDEVKGNNAEALRRYESSLPELERSGAALFLQAARYRIGKLRGGDEGAALCNEIKTWLVREGVRDPDRMLAMLLPGPN
jgi:serine/threonine protein kinase/tetratricopeptide (TPR) repeat protein